ncbi:MAG: xanthine dehydrogenase family protein molybdopterin-binding subunit, partial [Geminicoccaceae bacterium]
MGWVGQKLRRFEDPALIRGEGRFVADLTGKAKAVYFVRSPVADGRIVHIERPTNAVMFTADDLVGIKPIQPRLHRFDYIALKQPILPVDKVSYAGQPLAVVVADSIAEAEDVAESVQIDIEATAPLTDLDQAIESGAARTHDDVADN